MLNKTDVDNVMARSKGVMVSDKPSNYLKDRNLLLTKNVENNRINKLEADVNEIKDMLKALIEKVT